MSSLYKYGHQKGYQEKLLSKLQKLNSQVKIQERTKHTINTTKDKQIDTVKQYGKYNMHDRVITQPSRLPQILIRGKPSLNYRGDMKALYVGTSRCNPRFYSFINKIKEQISKSLDQQLITYRKQKSFHRLFPQIDKKQLQKYQSVGSEQQLSNKQICSLRQKHSISQKRVKKRYKTRNLKLVKLDLTLCPWENLSEQGQFQHFI